MEFEKKMRGIISCFTDEELVLDYKRFLALLDDETIDLSCMLDEILFVYFELQKEICSRYVNFID